MMPIFCAIRFKQDIVNTSKYKCLLVCEYILVVFGSLLYNVDQLLKQLEHLKRNEAILQYLFQT